MENSKQLVLSFINASNQEIKINIRSPAPNLSNETILQAMEEVVSLGAFCGNFDVSIKEKKAAFYVSKVAESVDLRNPS